MTKELTLPMAIHLSAVAPAVALGVAQLFMQKGTRMHKLMGWLWVSAMAVVAVSSFWIFEIRNGGGFSVIHLLSVWTVIAMSAAIWYIISSTICWRISAVTFNPCVFKINGSPTRM